MNRLVFRRQIDCTVELLFVSRFGPKVVLFQINTMRFRRAFVTHSRVLSTYGRDAKFIQRNSRSDHRVLSPCQQVFENPATRQAHSRQTVEFPWRGSFAECLQPISWCLITQIVVFVPRQVCCQPLRNVAVLVEIEGIQVLLLLHHIVAAP